VDSTIYELHVRDFSVNDTSVPAEDRGSYLAFSDTGGNGYQHLEELAQAGLNTVHLLPTFDIASIEEDPAKQESPACNLSSYPPDSEEQQACITAVAGKDAYNWGYDPWHWMAPEGSYASSAAEADGGKRVSEFRTMVGGLHKAGLRVVLDQVYNHTPTSGQAPTSVLDKVVPGYYQRLNISGAVETSTCCQNVATENAMGHNGAPQGDANARLRNYTDLAELGLAGNLRAFTFTSAGGTPVRGDPVDYNGAKAGYADQPDEVISYVDAHDNETIFDELAHKLPPTTLMADRIRMNTIALSFPALSQSPSFWHAGADLLRSKSLDRNSYNSGDWFNTLDWTGADNGSKWSFQKPLLANPALKPTATQVQTASAAAEDLLRLRFSTRLFRLGSADLINQKVSFPVSGSPDAHPGVIVMRLNDTVGPDADSALRNVVVVFNTSATPVAQKVAGVSGLVLSQVQANGSDPVVKGAAWDAGSSTLTVPARTVAVFVQPQ
jgi:pullulanase/glycogen debranching enzyme